MNNQLTKGLYESFPTLFQLHKTREYSGIWCEDGWFDLIFRFSEKIEHLINSSPLPPDSTEPIAAVQIKQKLGLLVVRMNFHNADIDQIILDARKKSLTTCEWCGCPGVMREGDYWEVSCEAHADGKRARSMHEVAKVAEWLREAKEKPHPL